MSAVTVETVDGTTVRSWSGGDSARGLLYLHGFERHPGEAPFLQRLARTHRVVAPEHPGYGESNGLDSMDHVLDLVLHYRRFVESTFDRPVDVVGHSLGGMFAAEFAAICPQLTNSLVLVAPYGLWIDDDPLPDPFLLNEQELRTAKWSDPEAASQRGEFAALPRWRGPERETVRPRPEHGRRDEVHVADP